MNERNDLVETLRHENAGLKEKLSRLSQDDREKKPKKKRKSRDYPSKDESYHGQGDEVIEIIHQKNAQNVQALPQNVMADPSKLSTNVQQSTSENTVQFSNSSKTMMSHSTEDSLNGPVNERLVYASGQKR